MALGRMLADALRRYRGRIALTDIGRYRSRPLSYAALDDRIRRCRSVFRRLGLKPGDRVLIWGTNSSAWATVLLACLQEGIVAVPLDVGSTPQFIRAIQTETAAKALFTDRKAPSGMKAVRLETLHGQLEGVPPLAEPPAELPEDALAEIVYTSGTTGEPKGVMLTHGNLAANLAPLKKLVWLPPGMRFASVLPLSHMTEQMLSLLLPLASGAAIHYLLSVQPERLAEAIRLKGIHAMIAVPGLLELLRSYLERHRLSAAAAFGLQFRLLGVGGAPLDPGLERWWRRQGILVVQGYGLTETGPLITLNTLTAQRVGAVGKALPGVQIRLAEDGEILMRGPNASPGYYRKPEKTWELYSDGWLRTGDLGTLDRGFLSVKGRKKDMLKTPAGLAVYPDDVERILNAVPGVRASCVLEHRGRIHAALILAPGAKPEAAIRQANARLASHQRIASWSRWPSPDFPRTPTRKVKRFEVAKAVERQGRRPFVQHAKPLYATLAAVLHARQVKPSSTLASLGMDSLRRAELLTALEDEFGAELEESALTERTTVRQLEVMVGKGGALQHRAFPRWQLGIPARLARFLLRPPIRALTWIAARPRCTGIERLRGMTGPVIFAANHQSVLDAPAITHCLPPQLRHTATPALADYVFGIPPPPDRWEGLRRRLTGFISALTYAAYPIGPSVGIERSMRYTGHLLDKGYSILIFPEGHRTAAGEVRAFEPGVGFMAVEMGVPVVPVRLRGLFEIMPAGHWLPRRLGRGTVSFGAPITFKPGTSYLAAARQVEKEVRRL